MTADSIIISATPARIVLADHVAAVDPDFDVQAVVDQKDRDGEAASPGKPANWSLDFSAVALPLLSFTASLPLMTA